MSMFFCFEIKNIEDYLKLKKEDRLKYAIELKNKLNEKFQLAVFPTCSFDTVLVKTWPGKELFQEINYPFAQLKPRNLTDQVRLLIFLTLNEALLIKINKKRKK